METAIVDALMQHPDFVDEEERSAQQLALLLEQHPDAFLSRFGRWLGMVQLRAIAESPHGQREAVRVELQRLTRVVSTGDDVSEVTVANRRMRYFDMTLSTGDYMSEREMHRRDPAGWEYFVGRGREGAVMPSDENEYGPGLAGFFIRALQKKEMRLMEAVQRGTDVAVESVMTGETPMLEARDADDMDEGSDDDADMMDMWRRIHKSRFIAGEDVHFDYSAVDADDRYDDWRQLGADAEERWFDHDGGGGDGDGDDDSNGAYPD